MVRLLTNGDGGDAVACLPILRQLGGGDIVFTQGKNPRPFRGIAQMLIPLCKAQPYVRDAAWEDRPVNITHDACGFRPTHYKPTRTLAESQAYYLGLNDLDLQPWLTAPPNPRSANKVIVARTKRYNNPTFPWKKVFIQFRGRMLFVGVDDERHVLERVGGARIDHHRVRDFLEMASLIAGSDLLISNQSCPYWLAAGLGHPLIQETEMRRGIHDSQVPRLNSVFVKQGEFPWGNLPKKMVHPYPIDYQI